MFTKNKTKFHWLAQESAPTEFPMRVINGTFYYHNQDNGLYVPTAASITPGWGNGRSVHVVGDDYKALPDRLEIRFFSFWENKLYHGNFDLPYDKILALFKEGVARNKKFPIFRYIIVGVAPGGAVAVWVSGRETREVFFGQAVPYEADIYTPLGSLIKKRDEYAESYLRDLPPEIYQKIKEEGIPFGLWEKYRKTYPWSFASTPNRNISSFGTSFFNGDRYRKDVIPENEYSSKPLPLSISFVNRFPEDKTKYVYSIGFDHEETLEAMGKLSANGEKITLLVDPRLPKNTSKVSLSNSQDTVELKKVIHK